MANYREFYEQTRRRKRKVARRRFVAAIVVLGAVLAAALLLVRCGKQAEPAPAATEKPQATAAPAPLEAQTDREDDGSWNTREPVEQTIDEEIRSADYRMMALPANGKADSSYLNGVTFLGDSLTVGFSDYQINLGGALICGYTGVGPDAIVNRSAVKSPTRGQEVALDVLAAAQPKKLYILLGTNTLTTLGYLQQNADNQKYVLSLKLLSFSNTIKVQNSIIRTVHPYLEQISLKYGEIAHCGVAQGDSVIYVYKVESSRSLSINTQIGTKNYLHCTGVGKCILAYMPEEEQQHVLAGPLKALTFNTIVDPRQLQAELRHIRALPLSEEERAAILGGNAKRLLQI